MRVIEKSKVKSYLENLLKQFSKKRNDEEVIPRYNSKNINTIYEDQIKSRYSKYLTLIPEYEKTINDLNNLIGPSMNRKETFDAFNKMYDTRKKLEFSTDYGRLALILKYDETIWNLNDLIDKNANKKEILNAFNKMYTIRKDLEIYVEKINSSYWGIRHSVHSKHNKEIKEKLKLYYNDEPKFAEGLIEEYMNPEIVRISNEVFEFKKSFLKPDATV